MSQVENFNFSDGETIPLNAGTTTSSAQFKLPESWRARDVLVYNEGTVTAFIGSGNGSATAQLPGTTGTKNATPVLAGSIMTLRKNKFAKDVDTVAAITRSGTTQLYFTAGTGS